MYNSSLHDTIQPYNCCTKAFQTCRYCPADIIIFRATNAGKLTGITTYRGAIRHIAKMLEKCHF